MKNLLVPFLLVGGIVLFHAACSKEELLKFQGRSAYTSPGHPSFSQVDTTVYSRDTPKYDTGVQRLISDLISFHQD